MKKYVLTAVISAYSIMATAQTNQSAGVFSKNTTNAQNVIEEYKRLQLGVISEIQSNLLVIYLPGNEKKLVPAKEFDASKYIYFGFALTINKRTVLLMPRPEYGFRVSAITENGEPVEPTSRGAKCGRYFDELKKYEKDVVDKSYRKRPPHWIFVGPTSDSPMFGMFSTPDELFNFKKPGRYTMRIEVACFLKGDYFPNVKSNTTNYSLVKFSPVNLEIIKKEDRN